ncbi:unnamed protein product [Adineta ricciae]|uniref:Uncharacterized protein n=1 Tax=Adineta ricciae TaxID=249248 RepID=A0A813YMP2_ADIRI|nr:unnamed protein product [Adineta ricciae]
MHHKNLTYYETPKVVRFEVKWVGFLSLLVRLLLAVACLCLMFQRSSYQIFDRSPISTVTIKVKHADSCTNIKLNSFLNSTCTRTSYDVNDFIIPATENAAVTITTRVVEMEHVLKSCHNATLRRNSTLYPSTKHQCFHRSRCILPPYHRQRNLFYRNRLCWFKLPTSRTHFNFEALDYIIFIKHFVEFTQLDVKRYNLLSKQLSREYLDTCEYDQHDHPLCPKFRLLKILQMTNTDPDEYDSMFFYGSLIEIRISWKCNLDFPLKYCEPTYNFERLDVRPYDSNPYDPGSNFLISRHFFRPNDQELHRLHTQIYNIHIVVSVTGEAGQFDLFQTTTSIGSFLGIFGTGAIVCDLLASFLSNFRRVRYDSQV